MSCGLTRMTGRNNGIDWRRMRSMRAPRCGEMQHGCADHELVQASVCFRLRQQRASPERTSAHSEAFFRCLAGVLRCTCGLPDKEYHCAGRGTCSVLAVRTPDTVCACSDLHNRYSGAVDQMCGSMLCRLARQGLQGWRVLAGCRYELRVVANVFSRRAACSHTRPVTATEARHEYACMAGADANAQPGRVLPIHKVYLINQ